MIDLCKQGLPPVAGGVLNQSAWFMAAYREFRWEENRVKNDG